MNKKNWLLIQLQKLCLCLMCSCFLSLCFICLCLIYLCLSPNITGANGNFATSPHGDPNTGVYRLVMFDNGECIHCHSQHVGNPYNLFTANDNTLCFTCHADVALNYPADEDDRWFGTIDDELIGYFESNNGLSRISGLTYRSRWPGSIVYENPNTYSPGKYYSPHGYDQDMPYKDATDQGLCKNCHNPHGTTNFFDMLSSTYLNIDGQGDTYSPPSNYQLCFGCHSSSGVAGMDEENKRIAGFYDQGLNNDETSGHQIRKSTGSASSWPLHIEAGDKLACSDCHNPHGSRGNNNNGHPNARLLSDQRSGWNDLTDTLNNPSQCRTFCFGCHIPSDKTPDQWGNPTIDGIVMASIRPKGAVHQSTTSQGCYDCHGRDYSSSTSNNIHHPSLGSCTSCHANGTDGSHPTHRNGNPRGVNLTCDDCHGPGASTGDHENHSEGEVIFSDGNPLGTTTVCNTCHSPYGTYNGVTDTVIGAANNWTNGVYGLVSSSLILIPGKEKWCTGCHDEVPAVIQTISASNVVGDEDAATNYGTGYGYYKTGHGLPADETYPASGNTTPGAGMSCLECHDITILHIDGVDRTYSALATDGASNDYQHGYRLKSIDDELPLNIPRETNVSAPYVKLTDFELCFRCHNSTPFTDGANTNTNFRDSGINAHNYHLGQPLNANRYDSDWKDGGTVDSRASCPTCHNVHGSTQLSMIRDGKLVGREPGFPIIYYNTGVTWSGGGEPAPKNVALPQSTGTLWHAQNARNICSGCHGSSGWGSMYSPYLRTPYNYGGSNDADTDGVADNLDNCPVEANPNQEDADADGLGDICDLCPNDPNNVNDPGTDPDGDGLGGSCDICPDDPYNDVDSDGLCAEVDPCPNDPNNDIDEDDLCADVDNCPGVSNPDQIDSDHDGPGDACDSLTFDVPSEYSTVQEAINDAQDGDTVLVSDGTYYEKINFNGKAITIRSESGAVTTIIDGSDSGTVVKFISGEDPNSVLDGFTIQNGQNGTGGAGIYCNNSSPTITNCIITSNATTASDGAGMYIYTNASPTITNCSFTANSSASDGGAIALSTSSSATITDCTLTGNTSASYGGGVYLYNACSVTITNSTISTNTSGSYGGAIYAQQNSTLTISETTLNDNRSNQRGGAISCSTSTMTLTNCTMNNNLTNNANAGGAIYCYDSSFEITGSGLDNNTSASGGAIYSNAMSTKSATFTNCTITDNTSSTGYGGGMYLLNHTTVTITDSTITGNIGYQRGGGVFSQGGAITISNCSLSNNSTTTAQYGGGLYCFDATLAISDSNVNSNSSSGGGGLYFHGNNIKPLTVTRCNINNNISLTNAGGLLCTNTASGCPATIVNSNICNNQITNTLDGGGINFATSYAVITNSNLANNYAVRYAGGMYINNSTITMKNSIIWGNTTQSTSEEIRLTSGSLTITYSDINPAHITGSVTLSNNINSDPKFAGGSPYDYHLQSSPIPSPCIDTGTNSGSPSDDIDADSRPQGGGCDIGSDETPDPPSPP